MKKSTLNLISLIGSNKIVIDKELEKHGFVLDDYQEGGAFSFAIYRYQSIVVREIHIKFEVKEQGEFADTIIIC